MAGSEGNKHKRVTAVMRNGSSRDFQMPIKYPFSTYLTN